jgi:polysaccharide biosynthesis protein PslH
MRLLVLTHRLPYAPNRGDRIRLYHLLKYLRPRAEVELVSLVHDQDEAQRATGMEALAERVTTLPVPWLGNRARGIISLSGAKPLTHTLLDAPGFDAVLNRIVTDRRPDVVLAYGSGMARWGLEPPLSGIPLVIDFVDMDSQKWRELASISRPPLSWIYRRESRTLGAFESLAANRAIACLVVNQREADIARRLAPAANVHVITNGVEIEHLQPPGPPQPGNRVVFCGVMDYAPNHDAMMWFVRDVWPAVLTGCPDATLAIVGSNPQRALLALSAKFQSITVTGRVEDVRSWLWKSAVSVAPLQVARGLQNKVLEAIAAGLPVVVTAAVAAGLPPQTGAAIFVADRPSSFADGVLELLRRPESERRRLAQSADLRQLSWDRTLEQAWSVLEGASTQSSRTVNSPG